MLIKVCENVNKSVTLHSAGLRTCGSLGKPFIFLLITSNVIPSGYYLDTPNSGRGKTKLKDFSLTELQHSCVRHFYSGYL